MDDLLSRIAASSDRNTYKNIVNKYYNDMFPEKKAKPLNVNVNESKLAALIASLMDNLPGYNNQQLEKQDDSYGYGAFNYGGRGFSASQGLAKAFLSQPKEIQALMGEPTPQDLASELMSSGELPNPYRNIHALRKKYHGYD